MPNKLPLAKTEDIVVQNVEDEILIYDLLTNKAFCLNETSAIIYKACDGKTDFDELKSKHQFTDDLIFFALDNLKKENLIKEDFISPLKGINRRVMIKKIGLATAVALPIIVAIAAPTAVQAAISCGGTFSAGTILGCTELESQCLNMGQMCASCSTSAAIMVGAGACEASDPFLCVCN